MIEYIAHQDTHLFVAKQVCEKLGFVKNNPAQNVRNAMARYCPRAKQSKLYGVNLGHKNSVLLTTAEVLTLATHCQYDASGLVEWLHEEGLWNGTDVATKTREEIQFGNEVVSRMFANYTIVTQYHVLGYRVDFYIPELNIAVEFDEAQHLTPSHKEADALREAEIKREIGCTFIRVPQ